MKSFVTGGTGFVGSHIVRQLLERGDTVRCLLREESPRGNLEGLDVELVTADLRDGDALEHAVRGSELVFHCAADYRLYVPDPKAMFASNVDGTRNVLAAAEKAGAERIVYTSTVGALGQSPGGDPPADETTPVTYAKMIGPYKKSKFKAERVAEEFAGRGVPVVIVNPSTPVGERDIKPTDTGQILVDFLNRKIPAIVDTGLNLIDVRDCAAGHLLAAEKGKVGEKYILGCKNLELREILEILSELSGLPAPKVRLPHAIPIAFAAVDTLRARLFGGTPRVSYDAARLARSKMFFDASKAVRELGLPQTPVEVPLRRALAWFRDHGYVDRGYVDHDGIEADA